MASYADVRELVEIWDGVLGDEMFAQEGIESTLDYWHPLAYETIVAVLGSGSRALEQAADITTSLLSLDLLDPDCWVEIGDGGSDRRELAQAVMRRHGLSPERADRVADVLETLSRHWVDGTGADVRRLVRTAVHDMLTGRLSEAVVPELGVSSASIATGWGSSILGLHTKWSPGAAEFADRFDLAFGHLYQLADDTDRACARIDGVVGAFMDVFCRECDPAEQQRCVEAASTLGVDVTCPLVTG